VAVTAAPAVAVTLAEAADEFLSSPRVASPNTRRAYSGVLDRLTADLGPGRQLASVIPAAPAWAMTGHGSCSGSTAAAWNCTSSATLRPPTSATRKSRSS
jgi:hypothetical protein